MADGQGAGAAAAEPARCAARARGGGRGRGRRRCRAGRWRAGRTGSWGPSRLPTAVPRESGAAAAAAHSSLGDDAAAPRRSRRMAVLVVALALMAGGAAMAITMLRGAGEGRRRRSRRRSPRPRRRHPRLGGASARAGGGRSAAGSRRRRPGAASVRARRSRHRHGDRRARRDRRPDQRRRRSASRRAPCSSSAAARPVVLTFKAPGFYPASLTITPDGDRPLAVQLKRRPARRRAEAAVQGRHHRGVPHPEDPMTIRRPARGLPPAAALAASLRWRRSPRWPRAPTSTPSRATSAATASSRPARTATPADPRCVRCAARVRGRVRVPDRRLRLRRRWLLPRPRRRAGRAERPGDVPALTISASPTSTTTAPATSSASRRPRPWCATATRRARSPPAKSFVTPAQSGPPSFGDLDGDGAARPLARDPRRHRQLHVALRLARARGDRVADLRRRRRAPRLRPDVRGRAPAARRVLREPGQHRLAVVDFLQPSQAVRRRAVRRAASARSPARGSPPRASTSTAASPPGAVTAQLVVSFLTEAGEPCVTRDPGSARRALRRSTTSRPPARPRCSSRRGSSTSTPAAIRAPSLVNSDNGAARSAGGTARWRAGAARWRQAAPPGSALPPTPNAPASAVAIGRARALVPALLGVGGDAARDVERRLRHPAGALVEIYASSRPLGRVAPADPRPRRRHGHHRSRPPARTTSTS